MTTKACAVCDAKCGNGTANVDASKRSDPIYQAMCKILCETRKEMCEGKHKGKTASQVAEAKAANSPDLKRAVGPNSKVAVNKHRYVRFDNAPRSWNRVKVAKEVLDRHLDTAMRQINKQAQRMVATKVAKAAARSWLKLVPILNIASTVYDIYDIGSAGYDVYKQLEAAKKSYSGDVYSVRPDVAVTGQNGQLEKIYDFKFDGDKWQDGQRELYNKDLADSGSKSTAQDVNSRTCGCDGPAVVPRTG